MAQTLPLADREFSLAFGERHWQESVIDSLRTLSRKFVDSYLDEKYARAHASAAEPTANARRSTTSSEHSEPSSTE